MSTIILDGGAHENIRTRIALHIINDIVPRILRIDCITDRIGLAYSWYKILCKAGRCPDVNENYLEWDNDDLKKIADALLDLARSLLGNIIK